MSKPFQKTLVGKLMDPKEFARVKKKFWDFVDEGYSLGLACSEAGYSWNNLSVKHTLLADRGFYLRWRHKIVIDKKQNQHPRKVFAKYDQLHGMDA